MSDDKKDRKTLRDYARRVRQWSRDNIPPGLRLVAGLLLIVGGIFGFLPILGFWMIPLGIAVAAADVLPILRWWRGRGS
ncbi:hypothetical protein [Marimonas lutisalis]|uniref:hypothetical protein n=1 Tax=Marimonas lutisalis TaxID=2545756 RepID=UPI001F3EE110|nr:hypothetical protein [Marimonas lutisalis]